MTTPNIRWLKTKEKLASVMLKLHLIKDQTVDVLYDYNKIPLSKDWVVAKWQCDIYWHAKTDSRKSKK